jgi:hypothetical protein
MRVLAIVLLLGSVLAALPGALLALGGGASTLLGGLLLVVAAVLFVGWAVVTVAVIRRSTADENRRPCPWCAELILREASVCRFCGRKVREPTTRIIGGAIVVLFAFAFAGCVSLPPQPTREQWMEIKTRAYTGVTQGQVLAAAERLFTLADGSDFRFSYAPTGDRLTAIRQFFILFAPGTDTWTVTATREGTAVRATVETLRYETPELYALFWSRMDYLLGLSPTWVTCDEAWAGKGNRGYVAVQLLCELVNDDIPPGAVTGR